MDNWKYLDDEFGDELEDYSGGKDALVYLIQATESIGDGSLRNCLEAALSTLKTKIWNSNNDLISIILFGTVHSGDKFENIQTLIPMERPEASHILKLEMLVDNPDSEIKVGNKYDLHEALWCCQSSFSKISGKVHSKNILLFTSDDAPVSYTHLTLPTNREV